MYEIHPKFFKHDFTYPSLTILIVIPFLLQVVLIQAIKHAHKVIHCFQKILLQYLVSGYIPLC